jgi:membrane protein DedA with SNARE-associated domain
MGLPIPEEVPVITAGILSSTGQLDPVLAFFACLIGAIAGDCVMYWVGYHFGRSFLRERHWWARVVSPEREAMIERQIQTHGFKVFFMARFMVGLRSPVYFSAGILHMPFRRFLLIDLFAATAVVGTSFWLSYLFGEPITRWVRGLEIGLTAVVVVVVLVIAIILWRKHRRKVKAELEAELEVDPSETERTEQQAASKADIKPGEETPVPKSDDVPAPARPEGDAVDV